MNSTKKHIYFYNFILNTKKLNGGLFWRPLIVLKVDIQNVIMCSTYINFANQKVDLTCTVSPFANYKVEPNCYHALTVNLILKCDQAQTIKLHF